MLVEDLINHVLQVGLPLVNPVQDLERVVSELVLLRRLEGGGCDSVEQVVEKEDVPAEGVSHMERVFHDAVVIQNKVIKQDFEL